MPTTPDLLLDTTVLSNFAEADLLWLLRKHYVERIATSLQVIEELQRGVVSGYHQLQPVLDSRKTTQTDGWLTVIALHTVEEQQLFTDFSLLLGPGEASCLALAMVRRCVLASDDRRARRVATLHNVALTGTLGLLLQSVRRQHLGLDEANQYLAAMVRNRYRSPVDRLDDLV